MRINILVLVLAVLPLGSLAAQPSLRIISPASGTTVHPGESLTVTVDVSPSEGVFEIVFVEGRNPISFSEEALKAPPYRFTVHIPDGITPGKYPLRATGRAQPGQLVISNRIEILVERVDSPVSLSAYPAAADFTMEQKRYLEVTGRYADGSTADLTQSSRIKYVSSTPGVATVSPQGIVTPVAPGSARVTITYGNLKIEVPVRVRAGGR